MSAGGGKCTAVSGVCLIATQRPQPRPGPRLRPSLLETAVARLTRPQTAYKAHTGTARKTLLAAREREREREQLLSRQIYRQTDAHAHRSTRGACGVRVSLYTRDLAAVVCRQAGLLGNVGLTVAAARHLRQPRRRVTSTNVQRALPSLTRRASISRPLQEQLRRLSDISRRRRR